MRRGAAGAASVASGAAASAALAAAWDLFWSFPPFANAAMAAGWARSRASARDLYGCQKSECPHPRRIDRRRVGLIDAADNSTIGKYVEVVVIQLARGTGRRCAFED
jgi:hypothetical protein